MYSIEFYKLKMMDPNLDKPEIPNYKHQIANKFQISISKSQIWSKANCLEFEFCYL